MGGEWACSFSRRSTAPEAPPGRQPSAEAAKQVAEQHAQAQQFDPVGPWLQAERAWVPETTGGTDVVAPWRPSRTAP